MRKNRLLLCIALMLVFAMSLAMFVACADDQTEQPVDPGTTDTPVPRAVSRSEAAAPSLTATLSP